MAHISIMSASDFIILESDELGNIKRMVGNEHAHEVDDEGDDDDGVECNAASRTNDNNSRLENVASMSESYSEILDSPVKSPTTEIAEAIKGSPMRIPSRRPMSLQQIASKCT